MSNHQWAINIYFGLFPKWMIWGVRKQQKLLRNWLFRRVGSSLTYAN